MTSHEEGKQVTVEKTDTKVVLKVDGVELTMSPSLARELGDALYKSGCDVQASAGL